MISSIVGLVLRWILFLNLLSIKCAFSIAAIFCFANSCWLTVSISSKSKLTTVPFCGGLGMIVDGRGGNGMSMIGNAALDSESIRISFCYFALHLSDSIFLLATDELALSLDRWSWMTGTNGVFLTFVELDVFLHQWTCDALSTVVLLLHLYSIKF